MLIVIPVPDCPYCGSGNTTLIQAGIGKCYCNTCGKYFYYQV